MRHAPRPAPIAGAAMALLAGWAAVAGCSRREVSAVTPPSPGTPVSRSAASVYAGSERCAGCHPREAAAWHANRHSATLRRVERETDQARFTTAPRLTDRVHGWSYHPVYRGGAPAVEMKGPGGRTEHAEIKLALGSGRLATTYLPWSDTDGSTNLRISYFPGHGWAWTPQQEPTRDLGDPRGKPIPASRAGECFRCHATRLVADGDRLLLRDSELGIGCERCHGPAADHMSAEASGRKAGADHGLLPRAKMLELCLECHRAPVEPLHPEADPELPRFKATALAQSKCVRGAPGKLDCLTCHDPHERLATGPASYDRVCSGCHRAGKQRACRLGKTERCVTCHMPATPVPPSPYVRFTNHWIHVDPAAPYP